jgi:hypothetical protein
MNLAVIGLIALGGLLLSLASKANAATPTDTSPQLPPPEPEPEADEPGTAAAPDYGQGDYASAYAASPSVPSAAPRAAPAAAAPQLSANRPFGDQPLEVDAPEPGEAEAAAAEERAEAQAGGGGGGGGAPPTAAGQGLSFKKPAAPATPAALKLAAAAKAAAAPKPPAKRAPIQAARELLEYVSSAIKSGQGSTLGTKTAPNPAVKAAQIDMGVSPADGIYGPATRNKGKSLTGKDFPARDAPPKAVTVKPAPPAVKPAAKPAAPKAVPKTAAAVVAPKPSATRSAKQAATELLQYAKAAIAQNASLGTKAAPNSMVKAAQIDMGVSPADGIYGPATRNRGKALTGTTFPAR